MSRFSILARIILAVVACQLLLTAAVTSVSLLYAQAEFRSGFDSTLEGRAIGTLAAVRYTETIPHGLLFDGALLPRPEDPRYRDIFEIRGTDGRIVAQSEGADALLSSFLSSSAHYQDFKMQRVPYRAIALRGVPILDDEDTLLVPLRVTVFYASPLADINRRLQTLAFQIIGASFLLLVAVTALAAWMVRRGLSPLHQLAAAAGLISPRNWDFQPSERAARTAELAPLVSAIDALIARLRAAFRQQKDFTSDAAHELKTSVAIVKSSLQALTQHPRTDAEYRAGLDRILEDCARLEDLLARMLRLARLEQWNEGPQQRNMATAELETTCEAALARLTSLAQNRAVALEMRSETKASVRADAEDLELIWMNLLENAIQYSPAGSKVLLRVHPNGDRTVHVSVQDSGPGIPAEELGRVFERFHRADPSRSRATGGFGLGLAISKALVEAYGGGIEALNRPEGGAELRVELPLDRAATDAVSLAGSAEIELDARRNTRA